MWQIEKAEGIFIKCNTKLLKFVSRFQFNSSRTSVTGNLHEHLYALFCQVSVCEVYALSSWGGGRIPLREFPFHSQESNSGERSGFVTIWVHFITSFLHCSNIIICICSLLRPLFSKLDELATNERMIGELWNGKDVEGNGRGLIWDTIPLSG
jgi:hypothetical protein